MSRRVTTLLAFAGLSACVASVARADYTQGFENPGTPPGWTLASGAAVSSTVHEGLTGSHSLYVPAGGTAIINIPGLSAGGTLTAWVFDQGNWATQAVSSGANSWRVGITPSLTGQNPVAPDTHGADFAGIIYGQRTWFGSTNYGYSQGASDNDVALGGSGSFWYNGLKADHVTANGPGTARADLSPTSDDGSFAADGGMWTQWQFNFDGAGNVNYYELVGGVPGPAYYAAVLSGAPNSFFVYGGGGPILGGTYVDNINFVAAVPEPASLSLLGLAAGGLLLRRRRRA